jgi:threonine aldolase
MTWRAGVDALSFGATKNGAMGCEAVILFGPARERWRDLQARAKRAGHMPPKMRYLAAQMTAYLADGLWLTLARQANASARELAALLTASGAELAHPVDGNEVFVRLPEGLADRLAASGAGFYPWLDGSWRFVCSWATQPSEIAALGAVLAGRS